MHIFKEFLHRAMTHYMISWVFEDAESEFSMSIPTRHPYSSLFSHHSLVRPNQNQISI